MQKTPFNTVLLLGSGALKIGEAGEFDYSGTQAIKALKEFGIRTILINPNIATVQTSSNMADTVYFLPVTPYFVERVIQKEKPEAILLSFGGQTALNCGLELFHNKILEKYNVRVLGTPIETIQLSEDREMFARRLHELNILTPKSRAVTTIDDALAAAEKLDFPVMVRAGFTLGGQGSAFCLNPDQLRSTAQHALAFSPQILVEESLRGWKEVEYEVVRDRYDNCLVVCNMENVDPLGIHTGESIVVAPSQTLNNFEYHQLRRISIKLVRSLGIVGECNVQFALDPRSDGYRVIELNARLSRSSALASKATGYPLAYVATHLALGKGLHEISNSVTGVTSAFFEPALDYVVCKIPRWDMKKFGGVQHELGSGMKSVGEVMAIGKTFEEVLQKSLRMIGEGMHGFVGNRSIEFENLDDELTHPTERRIFALSEALAMGYSVDRLYELTHIDRWFLQKMKYIVDIATQLKKIKKIDDVPIELLLELKRRGFSDFQIARLTENPPPHDMKDRVNHVRDYRKRNNIRPVVNQIDTSAAEFPAQTNYLYLTYHGQSHDLKFPFEDNAIVVLGSGAYRIGSSVEFDWCSVNAIQTIQKSARSAVMINYNPETVSTDYDMCDRLYFEELSYERVMDILDLEQPQGVILSVGGQIPNNLATRLHEQHVPILGTHPESIDRAENRHKFSIMLDKLSIDQPRWKELSSIADIHKFAKEVGYPLLIRPSYVLSGAAMNVVSNPDELENYLQQAVSVSKQYPVVVSRFIEGAKEIEIDAVAQKGEVVAYALCEHVEFAGVHSGDATMIFPPQKLYFETVRRIKRIARSVAKELEISGPFNMQFLARDNDVKVIECNLRASRSMPFVSKILKVNFIELATNIILEEAIKLPTKSMFELDYVGVKASQFSFSRLTKADPVLGVEMASTGEVGCIGEDVNDAILKAMLSVGYRIPKRGVLLSTGTIETKVELLQSCRLLIENGLALYATPGTAKFLSENGIASTKLYWPDEKRQPNVTNYLRQKVIDLVINIPKNLSSRELKNDYSIRRMAVDMNIPLLTNSRLAQAFIRAFTAVPIDKVAVRAWGEY